MKLSRELGVDIVTGKYPPGTTLPSEVEFAERMNVSRSVVREAFRMLAVRGLLESRPKTGTRIRNRRDWNLLDPNLLEWMFEAEPPAGFVRSLFELRMIVEPAAAELAARKRSGQQLATMGHAIETMARYSLRTEEGQNADQLFHATILEATDNELLINLSASIGAAVRWTTFFKFRRIREPRDPIGEHRELFEAIAKQDAALARDLAARLVKHAEIDTEAALELDELRH